MFSKQSNFLLVLWTDTIYFKSMYYVGNALSKKKCWPKEEKLEFFVQVKAWGLSKDAKEGF